MSPLLDIAHWDIATEIPKYDFLGEKRVEKHCVHWGVKKIHVMHAYIISAGKKQT